MRNDVGRPSVTGAFLRRSRMLLACALLSLFSGCNIGQKTTTLSLQAPPPSIAAGSQTVFTATISHNNGQFQGATWALTNGGAACPSACGTLTNPTNVGSSGNGDTATITYTAPGAPPTPNSVTVTATSVENPNSTGAGTFTIEWTHATRKREKDKWRLWGPQFTVCKHWRWPHSRSRVQTAG